MRAVIFLRGRGLIVFALSLLAAGAIAQTPRGGASRNASLSADEQAAALKAVREYARSYTASLPNYTCTQSTRQIVMGPLGQSVRSLQSDVIEEELSLVNRREIRTVTKINGGPPSNAGRARVKGTFSRGEFGNLLDVIFDPRSGADIQWNRTATLDRRSVSVLSFRVPQSSGYTLTETKRVIQVPMEGFIYADSRTGVILRIEMKCIGIPADSEYKAADLTVEYKPVQVAGQSFILPSRFDLHYQMTQARVVVGAEYKSYRRFSADTAIKFEGDANGDSNSAAVQPPRPAAVPEPVNVAAPDTSISEKTDQPMPQVAAAPVVEAKAVPQEPPKREEAAQAQPPETVFRSATRLVQVSVIAQDKNGKPVADLRRDEFQIVDNGAPQEIRLFLADHPDADSPAPNAPGTFTNRIGSGGASVLLFDRLFIDAGNGVFKHNVRARQKALQAMKAIPPGDRIAIYALGCRFQVVHELTSDRDSLIGKLNAYAPGPAPCADPTIPGSTGSAGLDRDPVAAIMRAHEIEGYNGVAAARQTDMGEYEFKVMADHLAGIPGRKNLIWVTSEFRLSPANVQRLVEANVAIYPVDVIGSMVATPWAKKARYDPLRAFAAMTGGVAFYDRDDTEVGIREALRDGRISYTLGFYPGEDTTAAVHRLGVRVTRPGVTLRYRASYELKPAPAPSANPVEELVQALNRPVDATVIPVSASATRTGDRVDLSVSLDVSSLDLELRAGLWQGKAELVARFVTADGLPAGDASAQTLTFSMRPATYEAMLRGGDPYRSKSELAIPAKATELKVLVGNLASGKIGTLTIPLSEVK